MISFHSHLRGGIVALALLALIGGIPSSHVWAKDFFLTIGGGYNRSGNQASLEANVIFFQQVLADHHQSPVHHDIFFADGHDPAPDVQIVAEKPAPMNTPATDLLAALHRRRGEVDVAYRDHRVTKIAGALDPAGIRAGLDTLSKAAQRGDRLVIYVTAHGSEGPEDDQYNTTIDCWNERKITAREFTAWLDKLPSEMPVVMVMAQCYCGGFAHTIFQGMDETKGQSPQLRAGFFAQRHDLPAAGCRPDIEHEEEFSSYFWGAIAGRSRNGVPIKDCDLDRNGIVSFAEAYAHAVTVGETIDIPLRTSEIFLRQYSQLSAAKDKGAARDTETKPANNDKSDPEPIAVTDRDNLAGQSALFTMNGSLQSFADRAHPTSSRIVTQLSQTLGFDLKEDVTTVIKVYDEHRREGRSAGRTRSRRQGSGRRELLAEVTEKWPELGDERHWRESALLKPDNQERLLAELKQLSAWKNYDERLQQMKVAGEKSDQHELRTVKFRRLIQALETIVLEQNLPLVATPEIVARYQQLIALEESSLASNKHRE